MFFYARRTLQKMDALGILKKEIENAVTKGMKWKEETAEKWHAQMAGIGVVIYPDSKQELHIHV